MRTPLQTNSNATDTYFHLQWTTAAFAWIEGSLSHGLLSCPSWKSGHANIKASPRLFGAWLFSDIVPHFLTSQEEEVEYKRKGGREKRQSGDGDPPRREPREKNDFFPPDLIYRHLVLIFPDSCCTVNKRLITQAP